MKCEICRRKFPHFKPDAGRGGTAGTLTEGSQEGIIKEDSPVSGVFANLCPQCREEAWEAETLTPSAYPYRH